MKVLVFLLKERGVVCSNSSFSRDLDGGTGYGYACIMSHDSWTRDYTRTI